MFFCELSKNFENVSLMRCKSFGKVYKNNVEKMFAKYLCRWLFPGNNTSNCAENDDVICFLILGHLLLLSSP